MLDPMYGNMTSQEYDPLQRSAMVGADSKKNKTMTATTTTTREAPTDNNQNDASEPKKSQSLLPPADKSQASSVSLLPTTMKENGNSSSPDELATVAQVFSFCRTTKCRCFLALAFLCAMVSGACMPALVFYFATAFEKLSAAGISNDIGTDTAFMATIRQVAFSYMSLGAIIFVSMTCQAMFMETVATEMMIELKTSWFRALLRQDMTYHDIADSAVGEASIINTNGSRFKKGVGRKLAESVQFSITFLASLAYSFWASWLTTLAVLAVSPFMFLTVLFLVKMSTTQTKRANASYSEAGSIVATAIAAIRTILALNATDTVLHKYQDATEKAMNGAVSQVWLFGLANGGQMASMLLSYMIITTFGTWLLYSQTRENGCDPSGTIVDNETCNPSAVDVFGSLMAVGVAAGVLPQVSVAIESFTGARAACFPAIVAMQRTVENSSRSSSSNTKFHHQKQAGKPVTPAAAYNTIMRLPEYKIDSSSAAGKKPSSMVGQLAFENVTFAYPTRSEVNVFQNFNLEIKPGTTVALVGPSGQGKSTAMSLIERFYDPQQGSVTLDGVDIRELNVKWLRQHVGLVSQEPKLFAKSIRENIEAGRPGASLEEIEQAAIKANAHDFIMSFPQGYDTQVGDLGGQLSGGQKQRIAIARVLVKNPKILLLDEATSALDSESEATVQKALDKLMCEDNMTTLVIAHRLSTIKNADVIAVLVDGNIVESGSHAELLEKRGHYFRLVEAQSMSNPSAEPKEESVAASNVSSTNGIGDSVLLQSDPSSDVLVPDTLIRFKNVHFRYPSRPEAKVFRGLNLSVKRGETLAIVGASGQGKSTIIALMERFYDPDEGEIELNGTDLRDLNVRYLRDQLGLVSQEPTLFDCSVADNITYGYSGLVTQEHIEEAAKMANAHDFIMSFPQGYNTSVGAGSALVSGGQKQRIALARALLRNPKILLLDEATSALDSESERIVQAALDKVMFGEHRTCVVIAHRLSTVRNATRIAVIDNGKVRELGTHDQLMEKGGRYARLVAMQDLHASAGEELEHHATEGHMHDFGTKSKPGNKEEDVEEEEMEVDTATAKENAARARQLATRGDKWLFFVGAIGALLAGVVFPAFGFVFAYMIEVLYTPVFPCDGDVDVWPFMSCQDYYDSVADQMRRRSWKILYAFTVLIACTLVGSTLLFWGFGKASEKMNKRVRDSAFSSLLRQEVAWFDVHTVGALTSQLAEDAALIHAFSGEPIRTLVLNLASVLVGVVVSFYFMWPFALLTLAILPFMAFGTEMEMQMYMGDDEGDDDTEDPENSPGSIVIETMTSIRTIASLTLEDHRAQEYHHALELTDSHSLCTNFMKGCAVGLGQFVQMWGLAILFWWGGWLLSRYGDVFSYRDFLISMMALMFSLYGLALAAQGTANRERAKQAAARIFTLIDRKSLIDPQAETGKKQV